MQRAVLKEQSILLGFPDSDGFFGARCEHTNSPCFRLPNIVRENSIVDQSSFCSSELRQYLILTRWRAHAIGNGPKLKRKRLDWEK